MDKESLGPAGNPRTRFMDGWKEKGCVIYSGAVGWQQHMERSPTESGKVSRLGNEGDRMKKCALCGKTYEGAAAVCRACGGVLLPVDEIDWEDPGDSVLPDRYI